MRDDCQHNVGSPMHVMGNTRGVHMVGHVCLHDVGNSLHVMGITKGLDMLVDACQHCACISMHVMVVIHILHVIMKESHKECTYDNTT